ncbi:unnamed protein product [marine sediment metagenome]|uniref:Solute-binding protein family 3/N-terminal domain-containing protein n=1 Tax=marine sediment metagenome TaxID=412755 RepID=X0RW34_9ZZZZ
MKKTGILFMFSVFGLVVTATVSMADCSVINIHYNERVPYLKTASGGVEGFTGTPATLAFKKAGITYKWKKTPPKRQMLILKRNQGCDCLVGWFKNPDREKFAKYTHHIYQDKPQIALARYDNDKIQK